MGDVTKWHTPNSPVRYKGFIIDAYRNGNLSWGAGVYKCSDARYIFRTSKEYGRAADAIRAAQDWIDLDRGNKE